MNAKKLRRSYSQSGIFEAVPGTKKGARRRLLLLGQPGYTHLYVTVKGTEKLAVVPLKLQLAEVSVNVAP
jgi:hypothetical protein